MAKEKRTSKAQEELEQMTSSSASECGCSSASEGCSSVSDGCGSKMSSDCQ